MLNSYRKLLTPKEQMAMFKIAMSAELAGASLADKTAGVRGAATAAGVAALPSVGMNALKTVAAVSVILGVPLGVAAHAVGRQSKVTDNKERDALDRVRRYRSAAKELERGLATRGSSI